MSEKYIIKRIKEMESEIYPLDRILPQKTVFRIFSQIYSSTLEKSKFFKKRKYQRLREGYWGLFVCKALDRNKKTKHCMIFPSDPAIDLIIVDMNQPRTDKLNAFEFDVKEFTKYSKNFKDFARKTIIPRLKTYGMIIGVYEKMYGGDLKILLNKEVERGMFIVSAKNEDGLEPFQSRVVYLQKKEVMFDYSVDIEIEVDPNEPMEIFQNTINYKHGSGF